MAHMTAVDGFSVFVGTVVIVSALLTLLLSSDYLVRRGIESRPEYVALLLFSVAGMLTMAAANDLIVVFVALEVLSIPLYVLAGVRPPAGPVARGRHQVLRARRVLLGDLPLRRRARLRRHRDDVARRDPVVPRDPRARRRGHAARRHGAAARRARLQDRRGAVPHVDARRLRGRAEPGDRVHGVGHEGRRLRRAAPHPVHRPRPVPVRLAQPALRARGAHAARRQHRRAPPDRPQAAARVLVDRARRVRAHRRAGRDRARPAVGARVPARLLVHDDRRVRRS